MTRPRRRYHISAPNRLLAGGWGQPLGRVDFSTEEEFLEYHRTGYIPPEAYERYEVPGGLRWLGRGHDGNDDPLDRYPILLDVRWYNPYEVEFRQSGKKLQYTKLDVEGWPVYGPDRRALMLSDEEIHAKGLSKTSPDIVAFIDGESIGYAGDEWGAIGVYVEHPYQRLGIGTDLLIEYLQRHPRFRAGKGKIGQMTAAGTKLAKAAYRKMRGKP